VNGPLTAFVDELVDAAWAGLSAEPVRVRPRPTSPLRTGRVTRELIVVDGSVVAHGEATAELDLDPGPKKLDLRPMA
jgi:hypothetical protein